MTQQPSHHRELVDQWLNRSAVGLETEELDALLQAGAQALWQRANATISEITLAAVFHRAVYNCAELFSFMALVEVDDAGIRAERALASSEAPARQQRIDAFRFLLTEILTILGNLTDEVLTLGLHNALLKVLPGEASMALGLRTSRNP